MSGELRGRRIAVTRAAEQSASFVAALVELGAKPLLIPAIKIAPPADLEPLDSALLGLDSYDWIVFTSANAVSAVVSRLEPLGLATGSLSKRQLAVIGPTTSEALSSAVRPADLMPSNYVAEALADEFISVDGVRFLIPCADTARPDLADALLSRGGVVTSVVAYRTVPSEFVIDSDTACPDVITFTSGTTVEYTLSNLERAGLSDWMRTAKLVCIGPVTAHVLRDLGYEPAAVADEFTVYGLIEKLKELDLRGVRA